MAVRSAETEVRIVIAIMKMIEKSRSICVQHHIRTHVIKLPWSVQGGEEFQRQLEELANASYENSTDIVEMVEKIVPTFHPVGESP